MSARLLVVQHQASCPPALLDDAAAAAGVELEVIDLVAGDEVPGELGGVEGLVVLGGTMGVPDAARYPHLDRTMDLIRHAARREAPVLGICLGAQLAAHALGGRAYPGAAGIEIGWTTLELTEAGRADPVVGTLDDPPVVFHWHRDTFDLPPGAALLASSPCYPNQAFRLGSVLALQWHPEVDRPLIATWYASDRRGADAAGYDPTAAEAATPARSARARHALDAFCQHVAAQSQLWS